MKARLLVFCLLLLAACAAQPPVESRQEGFVAADADESAPHRTSEGPRADLSLTAQEEANVALLINRLGSTPEMAARDAVIRELISLGPRYLPFYRKVNDEAVAMDMLYVIHRIELAQDRRPAATVEEKPADTSGAAAEAGPRHPASFTGDDFDRDEAERFMATRLKQAQTLLDGGRYDQAIRIAEAAIVLMPDSRWRPEFNALIVKARGEGQAELLIAGTIVLEPAALRFAATERGAAFQSPLTIRCYLKNVSAQEITLRLYEGPGKESLLQLNVRYEQTDFQGNILMQTGNVRVPIDSGGAITLAPSSSHEISVPLAGLSSLDADASLKMALGVAHIDAALRVYGALDDAGRPLVLRPVRFARQSIRVFPHAFDLDAALEKPLATLREYIRLGKAQEVFLCAHVIEQRNLRAAGDILLGRDISESSLPVQRARLRAMHALFNVGATWDLKKWQDWWADNRLKN
ncbi:MAG: hypothetical protein KF696_00555 [Planctomycetes bacterium]|nr:hypothetical protein [Planctomycetota bacterium]MCW8134570.1 hypothetical protein [Planctomycetota bacterium]